MSKQSSVSFNVSLPGFVFLVFLTLKLCGVIDWSWWWVTAPLWGPVALLLTVWLVLASVIGAVETFMRGTTKL